jgi:excisionase family DNA binding protein
VVGEFPAVVVLTKEQVETLLEEVAVRAARLVAAERTMDGEWVDREGVAGMLGYRPSYVSELVRRHGLPCHRVGRKMRFRRREVEAWAEAGGRGR